MENEKEIRENNERVLIERNKIQRRVLFFILFFLLIIILLTVFFIVDEREFAVVTRFGKPLSHVRRPGLNLKLPWPIDKAIILNRQILLLQIQDQSLLTSDQKNVTVTPLVIWQISDPIQFAATMQDRQTAEIRLTDVAIAQVAISVGEVPFNRFISLEGGKQEIKRVLDETSNQIRPVAAHFGITIKDVALTSFLLPLQNRQSVIQRMMADRMRLATYYRASGMEEALKIEAQAAAEHEKILGLAHAEGTAIRGNGEAEALRILGETYEKDPEFYRFIRSLESYEAIIGKQSTVFIEADSPLLKYFNGIEALNAEKKK